MRNITDACFILISISNFNQAKKQRTHKSMQFRSAGTMSEEWQLWIVNFRRYLFALENEIQLLHISYFYRDVDNLWANSKIRMS